MQVATLYYRRLHGHPHGSDTEVDPSARPWGMDSIGPLPRMDIDFDQQCSDEREEQMYCAKFPVEDSEKLPVVSIVDMPPQWPVIRQAQVGRAILTLVDDGSW